MAAVKGSKQYKMIVVTHRPALLWGLGAVAVVALLLSGMLGYRLGRTNAQQNFIEATNAPSIPTAEISLARAKELARNPDQLITLLRENSELKQQLITLEQSTAVDKQALAEVQETLVTQRDAIAQLQEDLMFYKQIAVPENAEAERGLVIGRIELFSARQAGRIRYKIEIRQVGDSDRLQGHANVNIIGDKDGERVTLPLQELAVRDLEVDIPLGFRYFQNLEGEIVLPEGFKPERVQVIADVGGDNPQRAEKNVGWVISN